VGIEQRLPGAVNLSARQLRQQDLPAVIKSLLETHRVPPHCLELEIAESVFVDDPDTAGRTLGALKDIGVRTSVDDFGTGQASLHYLKRFPFDILKIDRCFVDGIERDASNGAIVEAIVMLSGQLGVGVVAEGVETSEQLAELCARGCNLGQGYYFSPPVPPAALSNMLRKNFGGRAALI
jgi:EAL domain-containing protein (putative c-di-GMP-specific phosphodiesterase class I)